MSRVTAVSAATPAAAFRHFEATFAFETDCSDVHAALNSNDADFILLDVRGPELFAASHVPGACHLPYAEITAERMATWTEPTLFVVYCAGPHCNAAAHAALRPAQLGRPVKLMAGGMTGRIDEDFALEPGPGAE